MKRIDSHQHFWTYEPCRHTWMNTGMEVLQKDYGPSDLQPLLEQHHFDGCVALQASQSEEENDFLLSLAGQYPFIEGIVGWVDLQAGDAAVRLDWYRQFPVMKGFRHIIQDEPDPGFMLQPSFLRGIALLRQFGYTYDVLVYPEHLSDTATFLSQFPHQPFVLDHLAKPGIRSGAFEDWKKALAGVAQFENLCCKISGMVTEAAWGQWKQDDFNRYMDAVVELFGTSRIMYGSDWPVCLLSAKYEEVYGITAAYFSSYSASEQEAFFGGNASRFYGL